MKNMRMRVEFINIFLPIHLHTVPALPEARSRAFYLHYVRLFIHNMLIQNRLWLFLRLALQSFMISEVAQNQQSYCIYIHIYVRFVHMLFIIKYYY